MPPHCDSLDGPVVGAAQQALEASDVEIVLPFVPEQDEAEVRAAFAAVQPVRVMGEQARAVADRHFFETVVRIHAPARALPTPVSSLPAQRSVPSFPLPKMLSRPVHLSA
jgi:Family of unknown function (DUF6448)